MPHKKRTQRKATQHAGRGAPKFTPDLQQEFCKHYAQGGTVRANAAKVGVTGVTVFEHARNNPQFKKMFESAKESNLDHIEDSIHTLACNGNLTAMFGVLRARRPNVWRENHKLTLDGAEGFAAAFAAAMKGDSAGASPSPDASRPGPHVH